MSTGFIVRRGSSSSNELKFTKVGMWTSDNGSGYTFTADYDYAIVTASYGRDGDARRGMWMSVSGCSATDYGQSYGRMGDKSCEAGIITKILINPKKGNSVSWGPGTGGSKCAVSIVGIGGGLISLLNRIVNTFRKEVLAWELA